MSESDPKFGTTQSETMMYPYFPYFTEDQMQLMAPNYADIADAMAKICYEHDLIAGYTWKQEHVHRVMYIHFLDGEAMRLSDMQAALVLKGVLKGFKRLNEIEKGLQPQFTKMQPLEKKRSPASTWVNTPSDIALKASIDREREKRMPPTRTRKSKPKAPDSTISAAIENSLRIDMSKIQEEYKKKLDSELDDIFDGLFDDED